MAVLSLLQSEVTSSQSELWYRIGPSTPRLATHAQVIRQTFGGRTVFVLEDPAASQYYRLSEAAYFWLCLLDGRRTVDEAWNIAAAQLGESAPTQRECVELLSRLQLFGLLDGDGPIAADMVTLRRREAASQRVKRRTGMGVSMTLPLVNPEPFLERTKWLWKAAFSLPGFTLWLTLVILGLYCVLSRPAALFGEFNTVLDPSNLFWMGVILLVLRAWHELGHAAACKAMGARCTELGIMVVMLVLPFPYCDATSSWRLAEPRKRIVVAAGGMYFETMLAAIAAILWWKAEPGLLRTLCYNTMVLSGFTTILFNVNPLMRYDGYYILSDATGIANLWQRSRELLTYLIERFAFGVRALRAPAVSSVFEFWFLLLYAILSVPYRVLVSFTIIYIIWSNPAYMTLGAVLAVVAAVLFLALPLVKGASYLLGSPKLMGKRPRAFAAVGVVLGLALFLLGVVPAPSAAYAPAIVRAEQEEPLRTGEAGFVETIVARAGEPVEAGAVVLTLRNPEVASGLAIAEAALSEALAKLDEAAADDATKRQIEERTVDKARADLERARARQAALTVRAPIAGILTPLGGTPIELENIQGKYLAKGTLLGIVASTGTPIVRAVVSDRDQAFLFPQGSETPRRTLTEQGLSASVKVKGQADRTFDAVISRFPSAGSRQLEAQSLAAQAGGEIVLDPTDQEHSTTLDPQFTVDLRPMDLSDAISLHAGQRARVRFAVPPRPLLVQWWRRLSQSFAERSPI